MPAVLCPAQPSAATPRLARIVMSLCNQSERAPAHAVGLLAERAPFTDPDLHSSAFQQVGYVSL